MTSAAHPSEAHRRIAELVAKHGAAFVEKTARLGEGSAKRIGKKPQKRIKERCAAHLGIPVLLWSVPPGLEAVPTPADTKGEVTPTAPPPTVSLEEVRDPAANAERVLQLLRGHLEKAPDAKAVTTLANAVTSASRLLARLRGSLDVTEAQVLRSEAFARLLKVLRGVLEQFPGAASALDKALAEYEART